MSFIILNSEGTGTRDLSKASRLRVNKLTAQQVTTSWAAVSFRLEVRLSNALVTMATTTINSINLLIQE